ncbi:MAG: RIP metalloprotease RseP [Gemmatimonadota bacterium]
MTILATIIVLGVLIFVHELGHFIAARSVGIRVERFSIGLGPRVWGYQKGDTEYVLSAIPLGGYVKMAGMDDEVMERIEGGPTTEGEEGGPDRQAVDGEDVRPRGTSGTGDFDSRPVWARAWVISAGVIMNMLFAFGAFAVVAAGWGTAEADTTRVGQVQVGGLPEGAAPLAEIPSGATIDRIGNREVAHWGEVRDALAQASPGPLTISFSDPDGEVRLDVPPREEDRVRMAGSIGPWSDPEIAFVSPGTPADRAGITRGDRILAVEGQAIGSWPEFQSLIRERPDVNISVTIRRDGGELVRTITPDAVEAIGAGGETITIGQIGVQSLGPPVVYNPVPIVEAVAVGWGETVFVTEFILSFLKDLVTGQVSVRNLGSIVTIGEASGQAAAEGVPAFLRFMALFSVNLAILNLLPIPVLDGGHLVFLTIEAVRGRPVSVEQRMRWTQVGFVILIGIMALALGNDFLRLFGM